MTEDTKEREYVTFLEKEGYSLETTVPFESDTISQTKKARYGGLKCQVNGVPDIVVTKTGDDRFSIGLVCTNGKYWCNPVIYDLTESYLIKYGRELEMRIMDAWRELAA